MAGGTGAGAMTDRTAVELRPVLDVARRRIESLQLEIEARGDCKGDKTRQLQRLELYAAVVTRLRRVDALMPEVARAQTRIC
jgi:hypothetical protein